MVANEDTGDRHISFSDWRPELRTLRYFVCIAEERSVTAAANRIRIAQPALSRQMARLEADLGVEVFVRSQRGVELTEAGQILLDRAYAILAQLEQTHHDVTAHALEPQGVVVIGMPPTPGEFIAPPLLKLMQERYPKIELRFVEGFSRDLQALLLSGKLSVAVMHDAPVQDDIVLRELLVEPLCVIGAMGTLQRKQYTLAQAARLPLVMPTRPNFLRIMVDRHADALGLNLNVIQRVDGVWHLKALVRAGFGFTLLTYGGAISEIRQGTLEAAPITKPRMEWTLSVAAKADQHRKRAVQIVADGIETIVKDLVRRNIWR